MKWLINGLLTSFGDESDVSHVYIVAGNLLNWKQLDFYWKTLYYYRFMKACDMETS